MPINGLESLQIVPLTQREYSSKWKYEQIKAVKNLVIAARGQLTKHQKDQDAGSFLLPACRRYEAFFRIPEADAIMTITSVGRSNEISRYGLFVCIRKKDQNKLNQIVNLHIAKSPMVVGIHEAKSLSYYSPEQLETLADIITNAKPIDKAVYNECVRPGQSSSSKGVCDLML